MLKFRDLYTAVRGLEKSIMSIDSDLLNVCGDAACILTEEQQRLVNVYQELISADVDLGDLDVNRMLQKISECTACVSLADYDPVIPVEPPAETFNECEDSALINLNSDHIRRFRVYEWTEGNVSDVEVYIVPKGSLPYEFIPEVSGAIGEKYTCDWSNAYQALTITLDHSVDPDFTVPYRGYNIVKVVAELTTDAAELYGVDEVTSCEAISLTAEAEYRPGYRLDKAVDGKNSTYSQLSNQPAKVVAGFRFKV